MRDDHDDNDDHDRDRDDAGDDLRGADRDGRREPPQLVLGPDEIVNYPLRKATRGYRVRAVDDLLDQLAVQTQDLLAELARLEEERDRLRHQVEESTEAESMLKRTLVTAQRAAEASVAEAHDEADDLRRRARERVEELLADAAEQAHELREAALRRARADQADIRRYRREVEEHLEALRTFAADHRARLAHHLELQLERLGELDLPDAPPEPELVDDEILAADVEDVDIEGIVSELAGDEPPSSDDDEAADGRDPDDESGDERAGHADVEDDVQAVPEGDDEGVEEGDDEGVEEGDDDVVDDGSTESLFES